MFGVVKIITTFVARVRWQGDKNTSHKHLMGI